MKKSTLIAASLFSLVFTQTQAGDFSVEPVATAYWKIPFGASKTGKDLSSFGMRMDQNVRDHAGNLVSSFAAGDRTAVVDFRFNENGAQGVYVRGINMSPPASMKMGVEETVLWIVGGAALGAAALIVEANDHGGSTAAPSSCPGLKLNAVCLGGSGLNISCCV